MKQEINPKDTNRAMAFELWMKSPMPMVTLTKTFDVTRLCKVSRRRGLKFNMLLCWCIGKYVTRNSRGPLEGLWRKLTWINFLVVFSRFI